MKKTPSSPVTRKEFLRKSLITAGAMTGLGVGCNTETSSNGPNIQTKKKYRWTLLTTWPPNFPVLGEGAIKFADWVNEMSEGQMEIRVYGGGELVPAFECFDAVSSGTAEMAHGASYYWTGKAPSTAFFCAVPFGMNAQQMNAWMLAGDGLKLWREVYGQFNLTCYPSGNTGVQMAGWFNKEINTIDDFKGLKMRIPGLAGKVIDEAGGSALSTPGAEIYTNLERGVIDASEWIGPYHDYKMGFHQIAKYYYAPGWHEPGPVLELMIHKPKFDSLPTHLKAIIEAGATKFNLWSLSEFEAQNAIYLKKIQEESNVAVRKLSQETLVALFEITQQIISDLCASDPLSKKVYASFSEFQKRVTGWSEWTEKAYYSIFNSVM